MSRGVCGQSCAPRVLRDERLAVRDADAPVVVVAVVRLGVLGHERLAAIADAAAQDALVQVQAAATSATMQASVRHGKSVTSTS